MILTDQIVTISLRESTARRVLTEQEMEKLGLNTAWFMADPDPEGNSVRGCFNSHVSVARLGIENKADLLMVFEDDVKIRPHAAQQIDAINRFITKRIRHFDILYLGFTLGNIWYCGRRGIVRANGPGLFAYILSPTGMQKMAACKYESQPIDEVIRNTMKAYSAYPIIAETYPESIVSSTISAYRNQLRVRRVKNEEFWQNNYAKQKRSLRNRLPLSVIELVREWILF
jgi:glycosyl transferase family 25